MKPLNVYAILLILIPLLFAGSCNREKDQATDQRNEAKILFLHHSTGRIIFYGKSLSKFSKALRRINVTHSSSTLYWFKEYNNNNDRDYQFSEMDFPKAEPYGWSNNPYDYYNIWVKNAGEQPYLEEPTLEILTKEYDVIIWKHCFPVGNILEEKGPPDINSEEQTLGNYQSQYEALKKKMHEFPDTKFLVWTGAAYLETRTSEENAQRTKAFFDWVRYEWDEPSDNIFVWDFYQWETEGGLYLLKEFAHGENNSHPNTKLAKIVNYYFCNRIVDVIENNGTKTRLTGEPK